MTAINLAPPSRRVPTEKSESYCVLVRHDAIATVEPYGYDNCRTRTRVVPFTAGLVLPENVLLYPADDDGLGDLARDDAGGWLWPRFVGEVVGGELARLWGTVGGNPRPTPGQLIEAASMLDVSAELRHVEFGGGRFGHGGWVLPPSLKVGAWEIDTAPRWTFASNEEHSG